MLLSVTPSFIEFELGISIWTAVLKPYRLVFVKKKKSLESTEFCLVLLQRFISYIFIQAFTDFLEIWNECFLWFMWIVRIATCTQVCINLFSLLTLNKFDLYLNFYLHDYTFSIWVQRVHYTFSYSLHWKFSNDNFLHIQ